MIRRYLKILIPAVMLALAPAMQAAEGVPAQVEASQSASVRAVPGGLLLEAAGEAPARFSIYSITGQLVKSVEVAQGSVSVELPRGCYIVKTDAWSRQVVVR